MDPTLRIPPRTDAERLEHYGWRDVRRTLPDGTTVEDRVPLTLENLLHPEFGDVAMESSVHDLERGYLANVFRSRLSEVPSALVLSDCKVDWAGDTEGMTHHSPDVAVILGVTVERDNWKSFVVAEQDTRPALIVEIVSPSYRENDTVTKVDHYLRCRVPCYIIVDRVNDSDPPTLIGRTYREGGWRPLLPNDFGWLWIQAVGVFLGVENGRVRCFDPQTREPLGDYTEIVQELARIQSLNIRQTQRLERAEAKSEQADEGRQRESIARKAAEATAEHEAAARLAAEGKAADLEEKLRILEDRLRQSPPTP